MGSGPKVCRTRICCPAVFEMFLPFSRLSHVLAVCSSMCGVSQNCCGVPRPADWQNPGAVVSDIGGVTGLLGPHYPRALLGTGLTEILR